MARQEVPLSRVIEDDDGDLRKAVREGLDRPLILWGHPGIGQTEILRAAADEASRRLRIVGSDSFEGWDGFRDVTESGHFRELSLEKFLAKGERADPAQFNVQPGEILCLKDLNLSPTRVIQAVFEQLVTERKLLNNPLPDDVRIVATGQPLDRHSAIEILGAPLRRVWEATEDHATLRYAAFPLPKSVLESCDHWAFLPSVRRFVSWGRSRGLAEEVLRFLEEELERDADRACALLHAHIVRKPDIFPQLASPRAFADLGTLLAERRPCFSGQVVKDAITRATSPAAFERWLNEHVAAFDADTWIEAHSSLTLKAESVPGSVWLRSVSEQVRRGEARISLEDLPTYVAYERRSLRMWASQELGDEIGPEFAVRATVSDEQVARLRALGPSPLV